MDSARAGEPPLKRQKLDFEVYGLPNGPLCALSTSSLPKAAFPLSKDLRPHSTIESNRYIPAGCLRLVRKECSVSAEIWEAHKSWTRLSSLGHQQSKDELSNALAEGLFSGPLSPYRTLHNAQFVRFEFRAQDGQFGAVRVYILPNDIYNLEREGSTNIRAQLLLLDQIDVDSSVWRDGYWTEERQVERLDATKNHTGNHPSLFHLFNTIPSPSPDPELVSDVFARDAMYRILENQIEGLKTTPFSYQCRTSAQMLQRESQPARVIDPRLRAIKDHSGSIWYCDLESGGCYKEPRIYDSVRGGVIAETMGLGKTLICLSLILASRDIPSKIPPQYSVDVVPRRKKVGSLMEMAAATIGRSGVPWRHDLDAGGLEFQRCKEVLRDNAGHYFIPVEPPLRSARRRTSIPPPRKVWLASTSVVVVPPNLLMQWEHQIKRHTHGLRILIVKNSRSKEPLPSAKDLTTYDIVLFSKQRFEQEAADGSDEKGRRQWSSSRSCNCSYKGSSREPDCTCFKLEDVYHSPLKDVHFKRLITDEGHGFGNASRGSGNQTLTVVNFLKFDAHWIISGTPTQNLYGADVSMSSGDNISPTDSSTPIDFEASPEALIIKQERKDLEKLGNIATALNAQPWASDPSSWSKYVFKGRSDTACLKAILKSLVIRHRPEDVEIVLSPLRLRTILLEPCLQDKISLNIFSMMIVSNAVTSQRTDQDYLFHPKQIHALRTLVANLRQGSFLWSGFTSEDILKSIDIAKSFLDKQSGEAPASQADRCLLQEAINVGEFALANNVRSVVSQFHEIAMYVDNLPVEAATWALDGAAPSGEPVLMGASMIHELQNLVISGIEGEQLAQSGKAHLSKAASTANPPPAAPRPSKNNKTPKPNETAPALAGGVSVSSEGLSPRKKLQGAGGSSSRNRSHRDADLVVMTIDSSSIGEAKPMSMEPSPVQETALKSAMKAPKAEAYLPPSSPFKSSAIISTASAKMTYLMDQITQHCEQDKILIFFESENVGFYVAQMLECLQVKHLIYAKSLPSARKAQYIVTFNETETFRVLLMDLSQAAFGLDLSSASRVWFINPVLSKQVEAQAIKRAHRIGQTKPVFIETLVLKGSIEEVIVARQEDNAKTKSILDDQTMYDWIKTARFMPLPKEQVGGVEQMAKLDSPKLLFKRTSVRTHDPDEGLISNDTCTTHTPTTPTAGPWTSSLQNTVGLELRAWAKSHQPTGPGDTFDACEQETNSEHSESRGGAIPVRQPQAKLEEGLQSSATKRTRVQFASVFDVKDI